MARWVGERQTSLRRSKKIQYRFNEGDKKPHNFEVAEQEDKWDGHTALGIGK